MVPVLIAAAIGAALPSHAQTGASSDKPVKPQVKTGASDAGDKPKQPAPAVKPQSANPAAASATAPQKPAAPPRVLPGPLTPAQLGDFKQAIALADQKQWDTANAAAKRAGHPLVAKYVQWLQLRAADGGASFEEMAAFAASNPDWPDQQGLRRRAEERIGTATMGPVIRAFFAQHAPLSAAGAIALVKTLDTAGLREQARQAASAAWLRLEFSAADEQDFLDLARGYLRPADHIARADRLLWELKDANKDAEMRRLLPLLPADRQAWAKARLALLGRAGDAETLLGQVPQALRAESGLIFDQVRYLRRSGRDGEARDILLAGQAPTGERDDPWWVERSYHAREMLTAGNYKDAYRLAAGHGLSGGGSFADAEFLAGWIALRYGKDPVAGFKHFVTLYGNVQAPISRARGAYWAGRAAEAMNNLPEAAKWYRTAGDNPEVYYGQLALAKIGKAAQKLPADPVPTEAERRAVNGHEFAIMARLLHQAGETARARFFLVRLAGQLTTPGELAAALGVAIELQRPDFAVLMGKRAVEQGTVLYALAFPTLALPRDVQSNVALLTALARQESQFNNKAISPVGALGLMQLMPDTAQRTAKKIGQPYDRSRLTADPGYNARLGAAYFAEQLATFDNVPELALAAYNAGPQRVTRWLGANGDPRTGQIDMIDWVEMIPFRETRNYVQRVMEAYNVYRIRLAARPDPLPPGN